MNNLPESGFGEAMHVLLIGAGGFLGRHLAGWR